MASNTIVWALLLWIGNGHGGPAIVDNFTSYQSCEAAYTKIEKVYNPPGFFRVSVEHTCIQIEK